MRLVNPKLPELPSHIGKRGKLIVPPNGIKIGYTIKDEICVFQSTLPSKILCLQSIEFDDGRKEIRLGYYIIGKKPKMLGRWVWGQYAALMPLQDFKKLIKRAEKKGWI